VKVKKQNKKSIEAKRQYDRVRADAWQKYFRIGERIAFAHNNNLVFGTILKFVPAPDGMLVVCAQDKYLNHTGRPIYRRADEILSVEV